MVVLHSGLATALTSVSLMGEAVSHSGSGSKWSYGGSATGDCQLLALDSWVLLSLQLGLGVS